MREILSLDSGAIRVLDRLTWAEAEEFRAACEVLVSSGSAAPEIDFRAAGRMTTPYVGILTSTAERCGFYGRPVTLILDPVQAKIMREIGFDKVGRLRVAGAAEEELSAGFDA